MGTVSWQFKKFADASSKPWFTQAWKDMMSTHNLGQAKPDRCLMSTAVLP